MSSLGDKFGAGQKTLGLLQSTLMQPEPRVPIYKTPYVYESIPDAFAMCLDNMDIPAQPNIFAATMESILASDHPMLVEAVRKLYALGKLCLDAEDANLAAAQNHVRSVDTANDEIATANAHTKAEYERARTSWIGYYTTAKDDVVDWWNQFIVAIDAEIVKAKGYENLPIHVKMFLEEMFNKVSEYYFGFFSSEKFTLTRTWHKRKDLRLVKYFTVDKEFQHVRQCVSFISTVMEQVHVRQKTFLQRAANEDYSFIYNSKEYVRERQQIDRRYDWDRRKFNSYDIVYRNSYGDYQQKSWGDMHDDDLAILEMNVWRTIKHTFEERIRKGVDGYDVPEEIIKDIFKDKTSNPKIKERKW